MRLLREGELNIDATLLALDSHRDIDGRDERITLGECPRTPTALIGLRFSGHDQKELGVGVALGTDVGVCCEREDRYGKVSRTTDRLRRRAARLGGAIPLDGENRA